jgi:hypothetical protein
MKLAILLVLAAACTPAPAPGPMPPDATDGSPAPIEAGPGCPEACAVLTSLCGPQPPDCVTVFAHVDGAHLIRTPAGAPLTCAAVASATSKAAIQALGVACP